MPYLGPYTCRVHVLWRATRLFIVLLYSPGVCGSATYDPSVPVDPYQDLDVGVYPRASFVVSSSFGVSVGVQRHQRGLPLLQGLESL